MKKTSLLFFIIFLSIFCLFEAALRISGNLYLNRLYIRQFVKDIKPEALNIVCLGESSTAGLWVPWQDSYPAQLERTLKSEYPGKDIHIFVPPHVGQNTSQMANRIENYIRLYNPVIVILMAGMNNEWSFAESHIYKFLHTNEFDLARVKLQILLSNFRTFKLMRYLYLAYIVKEDSGYMDGLKYTGYALGGPELVRDQGNNRSFAKQHRSAFVELWRYDIKKIIAACKRRKIPVILMSYHINPGYLSVTEVVSMAEREDVILIRNDLVFQALREDNTLKNYILHDNWHPNGQGYALITKNISDAIKNMDLMKKR
jgi:lysophospholipase L1-like esterase